MASVLVFCVPCALMSICLDPTHLVTCLLINFPQLLSLVTLLICSLYNLLVFVVLFWFVAICWVVVRLVSCLVQPCPACHFVFPLWGCFWLFRLLLLLIKSPFTSCNWVLALFPLTGPDRKYISMSRFSVSIRRTIYTQKRTL